MEYGVKSHVGMVRKNNQDSYYAMASDDIQIFAIADGMGGHKAGEVASAIAIQTVKDFIWGTHDIKKLLHDLIFMANENILLRQSEDESCEGMGTTLTIAVIKEKVLYIGHVGDSRIYLYRNNQLLQLSTDHSLVNELVKNELITPEEAQNHPQKHFLLQALGIGKELNVEISSFPLERSDIILLCTDGLTDMLTDKEIAQILYADGSLQEKVNVMVEIANAKGGIDNITIILVKPIC